MWFGIDVSCSSPAEINPRLKSWVLSQLIQTEKLAFIYMKFIDELMKWSFSDFSVCFRHDCWNAYCLESFLGVWWWSRFVLSPAKKQTVWEPHRAGSAHKQNSSPSLQCSALLFCSTLKRCWCLQLSLSWAEGRVLPHLNTRVAVSVP